MRLFNASNNTLAIDELFMNSALEFGALLKARHIHNADQYRHLLVSATFLDRNEFARTHFPSSPELENQVDTVLRDVLRTERLRTAASEDHLLGDKDIWGYEYSESLPKTARRAGAVVLALHEANLCPPAYAIGSKNWETNWDESNAQGRNFILIGILSTAADTHQRISDVVVEQLGRPAHRMRVNLNTIEPM